MNSLLPIEIYQKENKAQALSISSSIHIFWGIRGVLKCSVNNLLQTCGTDQLLLINAYDAFSIDFSDYEALHFILYPDRYKSSLSEHFSHRFSQPDLGSEASKYSLKQNLAKYTKCWLAGSTYGAILAESLSIQILLDLIQFFIEAENSTKSSPSGQERVSEICQFIENNYKNDFKIKDIASNFYITPQYLSSLFKDTLNIGLFKYISNVRLSHALLDLQTSNLTIEKIADINGFANVRSFTNLFHKTFQMLPSEYRTKEKKPASLAESSNNEVHYEQLLLLYLDEKTFSLPVLQDSIKKISLQNISLEAIGEQWYKNYLHTICISDASFLRFEQYQRQIKELQNDLNFTYLRMQRLLCKDMEAFYESTDGIITGNFSLIDVALDFLYSINLLPHIIIDYYPLGLPSESNTDAKMQWSNYLKQFIEHCEFRYTKEYVSNWILTLGLIHEDTTWDYYVPFDELMDFYSITYKTIRECNKRTHIASPLFINEIYPDSGVLYKFLDKSSEMKCPPDIIDFNLFPIHFLDSIESINRNNLSTNPDIFKEILATFQKNIKKHAFQNQRLILNDWNFFLGMDYLNDTLFRAVYVIKNILETQGNSIEFSTWTLSDLMAGTPVSEQFFPGGAGLFTHQDIKKPVYYAYKILSKLGSHFVVKGENYFITRTENNIQILLYYYAHYSDSFAQQELFDFNYNNRYSPFSMHPDLEVSIPIQLEDIHSFTINETILNREHGSPYDTWERTGFISLDSMESLDFIRSVSVPFTFSEQIHCETEVFQLTRQLKPLEIRLIELHLK